jgi:acyl-CoA synthetase (AMP-forming)/AMP-acid ligase II
VATAAAIDSDGWLHTGDIGLMDDRGYLKVTGRIKDMYVVGGFNAYPAEIEDLLLGNQDIAQVAVIGARRAPGRGGRRLRRPPGRRRAGPGGRDRLGA